MTKKRNVADVLAEEAEHAEQHRDDDLAPGYRRARAPREPAQVYSLRIPVERLEQLRGLAAEKHMTPSALMRAWVLDRLDAEAAHEAVGDDVNAGREPAEGSGEFLVQALREVVREELKHAGVRRARRPMGRRSRLGRAEDRGSGGNTCVRVGLSTPGSGRRGRAPRRARRAHVGIGPCG